MDIRKISVGPDYKGNAMHYISGQSVLSNEYIICLIKYDKQSMSYKIFIENKDEVFLWKEFSSTMPVSVEYNINF